MLLLMRIDSLRWLAVNLPLDAHRREGNLVTRDGKECTDLSMMRASL